MSSPLLPEFFALLGIDVFLAISLLTCLLDKRFPQAIPYVYQIAALAGFGHLLISKEFMVLFGEYMRFWYCFIYLIIALANIVAVNIYLAIPKSSSKKLRTLAKVFFGTVTFPTILMCLFFISNYSNGTGSSLSLSPQVPLEHVYVVLIVCAGILGMSFLVVFRRKKMTKTGKEVS